MRLRFWWKKEPTLSLYQKIINKPQSSQKIGVKYPPAASGIDFISLEEILIPQRELLINIDQNTETAGVFNERYWPAIERFAKLVHLIPASENDHHHRQGGMLHHGLEVGLLTMNFGKATLYGKDEGIRKKDARERWLFVCFIAGLVHDLGKIEIDITITSETDEVWSPHLMSLYEWAINCQVYKYYVDWRPNRFKEHEKHALGLLNKVLTDDDRKYINELDSTLLKELTQALIGYSSESGAQDWPKNLRQMLKKADSISVKKDLERSRTPADLGLERGTPLIRHYHDGIRRMFKDGKWLINDPQNGAAWVLGPNQELYLVWERCGIELYDSLVEGGVKGSPRDPREIADVLARYELIDPAPDGSYYWRIHRDNMDGVSMMPLKAVRVSTKWVANLVEILPPGLNGSAQTEGDLLWSSKGNQDAKIEEDLESPVQNNSGQDQANPPQSVQPPAANLIQLVSSPGGTPRPVEDDNTGKTREVESQTQPPDSNKGFRSLKLILSGVGLGLLVTIIYFIHFATVVSPDISYRTAFWMMVGSAFDNGIFLIMFLITSLIYAGILIYPFTMRDIENAKKKAAEIIGMADREAQETKDNAEKEAQEIRTQAEKECQENRSLSENEAQAIRGNVEKEAQEIKEVAEKEAQEVIDRAQEIKEQADKKGKELIDQSEVILLQAQAEALEILERAGDEAKIMLAREKAKCKDLWSWCHLKAKIAGVTPEEWIEVKKIRQEAREVLQNAKKEEEAIISQARDLAVVPQHQVMKEEDLRELVSAFPEAPEIVQFQETGIEREGPEEEYHQKGLMVFSSMQTDQDQEEMVYALEDKLFGIIIEHREIRKRDLERKASKFRYENPLWELAINNLLMRGEIGYDFETKIYRCQHEENQQVIETVSKEF